MSLRVILAAALLFAGGAACSSDGGPRPSSQSEAQRTSPMDRFPVGATADFVIYAHCGVQFARIDGVTWRTRLHDDGHGNAPPWPQDAFRGTISRPTSGRIVYTSPSLPRERLVFRPAPDAWYACA